MDLMAKQMVERHKGAVTDGGIPTPDQEVIDLFAVLLI